MRVALRYSGLQQLAESPKEARSDLTLCRLLVRKNDDLFHCDVVSVHKLSHIEYVVCLNWRSRVTSGDGFLKSKCLSFTTLIPQLGIVRTQSPHYCDAIMTAMVSQNGYNHYNEVTVTTVSSLVRSMNFSGYTEAERSSEWLPWSSLGTLKPVFDASSGDQGSHVDDLSVSVNGSIGKMTCARLLYHTMTSSNIFRVTGHLCEGSTGPRWIPHTKASDAELWCFLWSASE